MLVIPKNRLPDFLEISIRAFLNGCAYHLFQNDYTPTLTSELIDFTECDFTGYAPVDTEEWGAGFENAQGYGEIQHPIITFRCFEGLQSVWGYFVTDDLGRYLFAERNPAGVVVVSPPLEYFVKPRLQVRNWSTTTMGRKQ